MIIWSSSTSTLELRLQSWEKFHELSKVPEVKNDKWFSIFHKHNSCRPHSCQGWSKIRFNSWKRFFLPKNLARKNFVALRKSWRRSSRVCKMILFRPLRRSLSSSSHMPNGHQIAQERALFIDSSILSVSETSLMFSRSPDQCVKCKW